MNGFNVQISGHEDTYCAFQDYTKFIKIHLFLSDSLLFAERVCSRMNHVLNISDLVIQNQTLNGKTKYSSL
ncbi:hypothetical protein DK846_03295 [Methanospirillum lacunae]|uniref:Uncharacterized protein n=1 Tax=Methanospirillum lacunae TaxID=668570 RepID=A0A2V2NF24_9EURY|nr:hypothetical protein DK846_03295 [Methanospirillum lacunae]